MSYPSYKVEILNRSQEWSTVMRWRSVPFNRALQIIADIHIAAAAYNEEGSASGYSLRIIDNADGRVVSTD